MGATGRLFLGFVALLGRLLTFACCVNQCRINRLPKKLLLSLLLTELLANRIWKEGGASVSLPPTSPSLRRKWTIRCLGMVPPLPAKIASGLLLIKFGLLGWVSWCWFPEVQLLLLKKKMNEWLYDERWKTEWSVGERWSEKAHCCCVRFNCSITQTINQHVFIKCKISAWCLLCCLAELTSCLPSSCVQNVCANLSTKDKQHFRRNYIRPLTKELFALNLVKSRLSYLSTLARGWN